MVISRSNQETIYYPDPRGARDSGYYCAAHEARIEWGQEGLRTSKDRPYIIARALFIAQYEDELGYQPLSYCSVGKDGQGRVFRVEGSNNL